MPAVKTRKPFLLPHENWFASVMLRRQQAYRSRRAAWLEGTFGPIGIRLYAASLADRALGPLIGLAGLLVLSTSYVGVLSPVPGYCLIGAGAAIAVLAVVRMAQAGRAGKAFRNENSRKSISRQGTD